MDKTENRLALMEIYRNEWMHRDDAFITMFWRFITISLVITFLPNLVSRVGVSHEAINVLPHWVFSTCGIITALFGMYLTVGEARRIEAIDESYKRVMETLPKQVQMIKLDNLEKTDAAYPHKAKIYNVVTQLVSRHLNNIFCTSMFLVVILLAIANMIFW